MGQTMRQLWQNPYFRLVVFLLLAGVVIWFFYNTRGAWVTFILAYTIAYLANPVVTWLHRRRVPRWAGVFVALLFLSMLLGLTALVVASFIQQAAAFVQQAPDDLRREVGRWYEDLPGLIRRIVPAPLLNLFSQYGDDITTSLEAALGASAEYLATLGPNIFASVIGIVGGLVRSVVLFVLTLFFLYDFPTLNRSFFRAFPTRYQSAAIELFRKLDLSVGGYIRGQLLVSLIVGVCIGFGMTLLGVPFALGIGFLAAVFNIVPFLGPVIAFIPAALLALTLGWSQLIITTAIFLGVNFLDGNVISPFIFSVTIKLHPVTILTSVLVGASLFGFLGAIVAVPTVAFFTLLYQEYYLNSRWYEREA
jgi:predicted PurR-regulated permease PerM